nr:META domain-containing protein [Corynebacterium lactis]
MSVAVTACSATPGAAGIVGKQWQVTALYDDPALPSGAPENQVPPTITLGQSSYTITTACGNAEGDLEWLDGSVKLGDVATTRTADCDPSAQTFASRFEALAPGSFIYKVDANGLRLSEITDTGSPDANRGWTAVSVGGN